MNSSHSVTVRLIGCATVTGGAEPGTQMRKDSLPVLRLKLSGGTVDTVARLSVPEFGEATFGPQKQTVAQIFGPTDVFDSPRR